MRTLAKRLAVLVTLLTVAVVPALEPPAAAGKLSLWRLKTYIPPADKILDVNAQDCAKKAGVELAIQTYTFDDMWTKFTAAIESKTLPDIAELDAVGPARLANLGRLVDVSDVVVAATKELGSILPNADGAVKFGGKYYAVPHYAIPLVLFYRPDILARAARHLGGHPARLRKGEEGRRAGISQRLSVEPYRRRLRSSHEPALELRRGVGR